MGRDLYQDCWMWIYSSACSMCRNTYDYKKETLNVEEHPQYIDLPHNSDNVVELSLHLFYKEKD
ncbi:unknown [Clostridium sp. CAG:590]|nr:unknown [Clostridium sp. CAG:590]